MPWPEKPPPESKPARKKCCCEILLERAFCQTSDLDLRNNNLQRAGERVPQLSCARSDSPATLLCRLPSRPFLKSGESTNRSRFAPSSNRNPGQRASVTLTCPCRRDCAALASRQISTSLPSRVRKCFSPSPRNLSHIRAATAIPWVDRWCCPPSPVQTITHTQPPHFAPIT